MAQRPVPTQPEFSSPPPEPFKAGDSRTVPTAALEHAQHALEAEPTPAMRMQYAQVLATIGVHTATDEVVAATDGVAGELFRLRLLF